MLSPPKPATSSIIESGTCGTVLFVVFFGLSCLIARGQEEGGDYSEDVRQELGVNPLKQVPLVMLYRMDIAKEFDGVLQAEEIPDVEGADKFVKQVLEQAKFEPELPVDLAELATAWQRNASPQNDLPPESVVRPDPTQRAAKGAASDDDEAFMGGESLDEGSTSEASTTGSTARGNFAGGASGATANVANVGDRRASIAAEGLSDVRSPVAHADGIRQPRTGNRDGVSRGIAMRNSAGASSSPVAPHAPMRHPGEMTEDRVALASRSLSLMGTRNTTLPSPSNTGRAYAGNFLGSHDENRNGTLERKEWSRIHASWGEADRNGDSKLDVDEIARRFDAYRQQGKPSGQPGGESIHGRSSAGATWDSSRKPLEAARETVSEHRSPEPPPDRIRLSYFRYERIVAGMPPWFIEKDRDKDGQVMMYEYADDWTEEKIDDYRQYDLNDDGIITPAEVRSLAKRSE